MLFGKLMLSKHNVLLMDEPTNHLDIESILWLEQFIGDYPGAVLMTCHDKDFMNRIVDRVLETTGWRGILNCVIGDVNEVGAPMLDDRRVRVAGAAPDPPEPRSQPPVLEPQAVEHHAHAAEGRRSRRARPGRAAARRLQAGIAVVFEGRHLGWRLHQENLR